MTKVNEIAKLYLNKQTVNIDGAELEIEILSLDDTHLLSGVANETPEQSKNRVIALVAKSLGSDAETVKKIPIKHLENIMNKIFEANGMKEDLDEAKSAFFDRQRKNQKEIA